MTLSEFLKLSPAYHQPYFELYKITRSGMWSNQIADVMRYGGAKGVMQKIDEVRDQARDCQESTKGIIGEAAFDAVMKMDNKMIPKNHLP